MLRAFEIIPGIYVGFDGTRRCLITTMDVDLCLSFNRWFPWLSRALADR